MASIVAMTEHLTPFMIRNGMHTRGGRPQRGARRALCMGLGLWLHTVPSPGADLALQSPPDRAVTHLSLPMFQWRDVVEYPFPGTYELQIARDRTFTDLADTDEVPALVNFYAPARELSPGEYHWRVRYLTEAREAAPWSVPALFRVRALDGDDVVRVSAGATWEDIAAAYRTALERASRQPPGRPGIELRFEKAVYELEQPPGRKALFETPPGLGGVIIHGQGATFILRARGSGACGFFHADGPDSKSIQIKHCVVDYHADSLTTVAARVIERDRRSGRFTAELLPAYAAVWTRFGDETEGVFLAKDTFQRRLESNSARTDLGWGAARDAATGRFHFKVSPSALQEVEPGDYWVAVRYGGGDLFTVDNQTRDVVVNHNTFYAARTRIGNIGQRARFVGNGFLRKPGRVWCIPKGGFGTVYTQHTWIEDNVIQGTRDDMYHLLHGYGVIRSNRLEAAFRNSIHVHGERVWVEGNIIQHAGAGGIHIGGKGIVTKQLGDAETRLTSTEYRGLHGLIIRGNTIIAPREQGIHTRRPDSDVFAAVRFKGIVEPQYEGFQFSDIRIEDNTILDAGRNQAIYVHGKDIQILNNIIANQAATAFGPGSFPGTEIGIHVDRCRDVVVDGNRVADRRLRPDRDVVVRQSPNTMVNGQLFRDDPARLLDYLNLPVDNLAWWYQLNETRGSTALDSVRQRSAPVKGTWAPGEGVSGRPLHRQVYCIATASWKPPEPSGAALRLNGQDDVLEFDGREVLPGEIKQLSVSLFFNAGDSIVRAPQVLWELHGSGSVPGGMRLFKMGRELRAEARCGATTVSLAVPFYYDKYWQHAAVIFDRGRLQLFLNGCLVMEETGGCVALPPAHSMRVGAGYDATGAGAFHFKGMVDDVRVYRGAIPRAGDVPASGARYEPVTRPNIVLILADDLGWSDLGCYGGEIHTPHLDRLAEGGVRFTQFHNSAKCEPTRASLLSGHYWQDVGLTLRRNVTMGQALREAGYATFAVGKWHLAGNPVERGFDRYFGHLSGASDYFKGHASHHLDAQPFTPERGTFYTTDANADFAIRFIEESRRQSPGKPFFLYLAFNAPHSPLQAWPEDIARYRGRYRAGWDAVREQRYRRMLELGLIKREWALPPRPETVPAWSDLSDLEQDFEDLRMAIYAAMVDRMDQAIGRVLGSIKRLRIEDNTLVMFLSDNGASPFDRGRRGTLYRPGSPPDPNATWQYGLGWAVVSGTPFQHYKRNMFNGGVCTPFIASWPAVIKEGGAITDQPAHIIDVMATLVDVAQWEWPKVFAGRPNPALPGKSLRPILQGHVRQPHEALFFHLYDHRAVIAGDWKLVSDWGRPWALFNLTTDRTELRDLAGSAPGQVMRLEALWREWWSTKDPSLLLTPETARWIEPSYRHLHDGTEDTQGRIR